jgi:luciferase-type oxidoreductase
MTTTSDLTHTHPGFRRVFAPDRLTLGFILPLEGYPDGPSPTMRQHARITRQADELGFGALWARDVPTYDPSFDDVGQVFDPFTYLAFLAANTQRISLGTAAAVITLRHPIHLAKQAASVDVLSGGRLLLGMASGDRPAEYPLFNLEDDYPSRGERFQEAFAMLRTASEQSFPSRNFPRYGEFQGHLDVIPKPFASRFPSLVVGRSRQEIKWTAANTDGWFFYYTDLQRTAALASLWRDAVQKTSGNVFKPFAQGMFFELLEDPDAPVRPIHSGMAAGRNSLNAYLQALQDAGVNHVAFNPKMTRRPFEEVMQELAEFVLPQFASMEQV